MDKIIYYFGGKHPCLNEAMLKYPPSGYRIFSNVSSCDFYRNKEYDFLYSSIKRNILKFYETLKLPRIFWVPYSSDLIHSFGGFIPLNNKPWVTSLEYVSSFFSLNDRLFENSFSFNTLYKLIAKENCKKILPFSYACLNSIKTRFKSNYNNIKEKFEVLYPPISVKNNPSMSKKRSNSIRMLHVSGNFLEKGGRELLEAYKILQKKYDVELYMIVGSPSHSKEYLDVYMKKFKNYNVRFIRNTLPRAKLFDYYRESDVFVLPTYVDNYPYVLLEAMSCGLPLITTNIYSLPEIVEDGLNGFLISSPLSTYNAHYVHEPQLIEKFYFRLKSGVCFEVVDGLVEKLSIIIENDSLRRRMGVNSYNLVNKGKFSIHNFKQKLKIIYDKSLY